jgi:uncharacterized protein with HEPN domain
VTGHHSGLRANGEGSGRRGLGPGQEDPGTFWPKYDRSIADLAAVVEGDPDVTRRFALRKAVEDVGELVSRFPPEVIADTPAVPWKELRGMRIKIAHNAWAVDDELVRETARREIPAIDRIISRSRDRHRARDWPERDAGARTLRGRRGLDGRLRTGQAEGAPGDRERRASDGRSR